MHRDDPADMSIDDRLEELAALLAAGFLRLKRRTGCELTQAQVQHVLERFWRGDPARTGRVPHWGLGLSLVQRVTGALGGTVAAEIRHGGVFRVSLALPGEGPPAASTGGAATGLRELSVHRVVRDPPWWRRLIGRRPRRRRGRNSSG